MAGTGSKPTHLDLFSGIGGFALAAQWAGFRTIGFCEIDGYCQKVLAKNFNANAASERRERCGDSRNWRNGPENIYPDIFELDGTAFQGVSLITGGFPCQPFSVAGKRGGANDDRAIWPEMFRVIKEARPAWVLGENVPGIIPMELDNVLFDLEGIGYATRAFVIPACAVDARHRRDRVWIVGRRLPMDDAGEQQRNWGSDGTCRWPGEPIETLRDAGQGGGKEDGVSIPESLLGRVAHGIPSRVDRLKGLGNAIVPQVACEILREIRKLC